MTSLVQLESAAGIRSVAIVDGDHLRLLDNVSSVYALAQKALASGKVLLDLAHHHVGDEFIPYDVALHGEAWRILPAFDHPDEPARCHVTGTGLTHRASVENRNAMHVGKTELTDSMRMYQWGLEGGRPEPGEIGVSPEWFYKGNGTILRGYGAALEIPAFADDGGEEAEIAGIYLVDHEGHPRRVGMAQGNEFSDHVFEKKNYLYLASSKLRQCSVGPELVLDPEFAVVPGMARIYRGGAVLWEKPIRTGEENMCHSVENMEHHHFKFPLHRRPNDVHIHFFGASAFSFGDKVHLTAGDVMEVSYQGFGRPLRNPVTVQAGPAQLARVLPI